VTLGIMLGGLIGVILPEAVEESVIGLVFPHWVFYLFNAIWFSGGAASTYGLLRGRADIEVGGLALVASGLTAYYLAVVSVRASAALLALFIICLAVGSVARVFALVHRGGYLGEREE
jgi:hypothetical protein